MKDLECETKDCDCEEKDFLYGDEMCQLINTYLIFMMSKDEGKVNYYRCRKCQQIWIQCYPGAKIGEYKRYPYIKRFKLA